MTEPIVESTVGEETGVQEPLGYRLRLLGYLGPPLGYRSPYWWSLGPELRGVKRPVVVVKSRFRPGRVGM